MFLYTALLIILSGEIKINCTFLVNTLSLAVWSVCDSPINSTLSPDGVYFEHWSIIKEVRGLIQSAMLPELPVKYIYIYI